MMPIKFPVKSLDAARYAETFQVFCRYSLEYETIENTIRELLLTLPESYALLDVGAGTGKILEALGHDFCLPPSEYCAFEPNAAHFAALKDKVMKLGLPKADLRQSSYDGTEILEKTFDLVLFSHSLYWMKDPVSVFEKSLKHLRPQGFVMGVLQGPYGVYALLNQFEPFLERKSPMLQNNAYSSFELMNGLRRHGYAPVLKVFPTPLDMTGLFEPEKTRELSELLSFCLQLELIEVETSLRKDIIDFVRGATVPVEKREFWFIPNAIVTLSAPA